MRILVTGGAGFIGSHIVEHFQGLIEVRVLDDLRSGFRHNLAGFQCKLLVGSVLDRDPHALSSTRPLSPVTWPLRFDNLRRLVNSLY